ncbi:GNAT family N-acetyltransferase [Devosia sp.]|uniref:GNAT family N-acetyltransferase n=1 Tax=Devosia sp. TaxID=1871048 RepID=UPI003A8CEA4D
MELRTARLILRRARPEDLQDIHAVMSSPAAMQYWSRLPHESLAVTEEWFPRSLLCEGNPEADEWVIEFGGRAVGYVGIWKPPEFGFILHPDVWGQGIGSEAVTAYLDHAFDHFDIDEITADVDPRNAGSLRLLEKHGFRITGTEKNTFKLGEEWADSVYLSLQRSDWVARSTGSA